MAKGGRQESTTTYEMSPEQRRLIAPTIPIFEDYLRNPAQLPGFSRVAGLDPSQLAAQRSLLGAYLPMTETANAAGAANRFLLSPDILDPRTNPALQGTIDAATRPINENYLETILPSVRGEAITGGQFGSSRQGIAEGLAARGTQNAVGDASSRLAWQGYNTGLNAMQQGLALSPQTIAGMMLPSMAQSAVGEQNRAYEQELINERYFRDMYQKMAPYMTAQEIAAIGAGIPGGTTRASTPGPQEPGIFQYGLSLGPMLLSLFMGGNPFTGGFKGAGLF